MVIQNLFWKGLKMEFKLLPFLPEGIILLTIVLILIANFTFKGKKNIFFSIALIGLFVSTIAVILSLSQQGKTAINNFFQKDLLSEISQILILFSTACSLIYGKKENPATAEFYSTFLFATFGGMLLTIANDLTVLLVSLEALAISLYLLIAMQKANSKSAESVFKYFLMNSLGFAFITFSFAILYGISGSTLIENIVNFLEANSFNASLFILSLVMACAGFFLKLGIFPFHSWVPDVYEGTPLNIAMFVSSGVKVAIFTAFLRLFIPVFGISPIWIKVFLVFSVISIIAGSLMMLGQDNIRRLLGFSDIVHSGTILSVLVVIPSLAIFSTVFYLIAYAFTMISSFALVGIVGEEFNMWRGIFKEIPLLGGSGIVAFMSLAGLPPFAGFWAKFFVLLSLIHNNFFFMALLVAFSSLLALYGYLKPIAESYKENKSLSLKQVNFWKFLVLSVSVLAIVVLGVFPELITGKITEAVISFLSQNG